MGHGSHGAHLGTLGRRKEAGDQPGKRKEAGGQQVVHILFMQVVLQCGREGGHIRLCPGGPVNLPKDARQVGALGKQCTAERLGDQVVQGIAQQVLADIGPAAFIAQDKAQGRQRRVQLVAIIIPGVHAGSQDERKAALRAVEAAGSPQ